MWAVLTPKKAGYDRTGIPCIEVEKITAKMIFAKSRWAYNSRYAKSEYRIDVFDDEATARDHHSELLEGLGLKNADEAYHLYEVARDNKYNLMSDHGNKPAKYPAPDQYRSA